MSKYEEGLSDGLQVKTLTDYVKIKRYIREYMGSNLKVVLEDEGDKSVVSTESFSDALAKVIASRLQSSPQEGK